MEGKPTTTDAPNPKAEKEETKTVEILTLASVLIFGAFGVIQFYGYERVLIELDRTLKEVELEKANAEVLSVIGEVLSPEAHVVVGGENLTLFPIYIRIQNDGATFVDLKAVEFRVFVAPLADVGVWKKDSGEQPVEKLPIGMLDADSAKWQEVAELKQSLQIEYGRIAPGTSRTERRHVISKYEVLDVLKKIEVLVTTANRTYRWYGFVADGVCSTEPFSSSSASAYASEPVAAPAVEEAPAAP